MNYYDSYEAERLKKLIAYKEKYLQTLAANNNKAAYQIMQAEILFMKNSLLPIVLADTNIIHSEFSKYAARALDVALTYKCNGLLMYIALNEEYTDRPLVGIVNDKSNLPLGTPQAVEIHVCNMDLNGCKVQPMNINIENLL